MDICRQEEPPFKDYGSGHYAACYLYEVGKEAEAAKTAAMATP